MSPFVLDRYEVTVGRFRNFLDAYDDSERPKPGQGAHPNIADSGWRDEWTQRRVLPGVAAALAFTLSSCGQAIDGSVDDRLPVRCVSWYAALAFCIWDGGRLPTEAEWSFAAMGGDSQRTYPWSSSDMAASIDEWTACYSDDDRETRTQPSFVGAHGAGAGEFGHEDLAGNLWEWVADGYLAELERVPCRPDETRPEESVRDCQELDAADARVLKGGSYVNDAETLKTRTRTFAQPTERNASYGFRCAHSPD